MLFLPVLQSKGEGTGRTCFVYRLGKDGDGEDRGAMYFTHVK